MMYPVKVSRGRIARRLSVVAAALGMGLPVGRASATVTETQFTGGSFSLTIWNTASAWSKSIVPVTGNVADDFKSITLTYNVTTVSGAADLAAVQVAGNTSSGTAILSLSSSSGSPYLDTGELFIGAGVTGQSGYAAGAGPGQVVQSAGTINIDQYGVLAIDPNSLYSLSGTGVVLAYNEQNAGSFSQNGGSNLLAGGAVLTNTGTYTDVSTGQISADLINNTGTFNVAGGTIAGTSSVLNFTNNGTLLYSSGTITGTITNNSIMTATATTLSAITGSLVNSGKLTVTGATGNFSANLSGGGLLVFNGAGSVTLTGTNTYTGQTTVVAGTLYLNSPPGTSGNNFGGALQGSVVVDTGATLVNDADMQVATTSAITINGGTYNLNGHNNSIGSLTMTAGQVEQSTGSGLGVSSGQVTIGSGTATITGGLQSSSTFNFNVSSAGTLNIIGPVGGYNTASGSLILNGGGTVSISGTSPLSTIDIKSGKLVVSESGTLGGVNTSTTIEGAGTLSLTNQALTIGNLIGGGAVSLGTGSLTVVSTGSTFPGTISGSGSLVKSGTGTLILTGADISSGTTEVASGNLTVAATGSISGSSIIIDNSASATFIGGLSSSPAITDYGSVVFAANPGGGILERNIGIVTVAAHSGGNGQLQIAAATSHSNRTLLVDSAVSIAGTTNAWTGLLDLTNNDMDVTSSVLPIINSEVATGYDGGTWKGNGITSSTAAADTSRLTALGVILNNDGFGNPLYGTGTALGLFDGITPGIGDVLVKYTYYGDANLDGKVDGSDYARIDNGFLHGLTGWYNGDFNYDGVVNGSDYTLMDNTFNQQGAALSATIDPAGQIAAQIGGVSSVPEPASTAVALLGSVLLLSRRTKRNSPRFCSLAR
jgi:autotransporter-associated beta strand protein